MTDPTNHDKRDVVMPTRPSTTPFEHEIADTPTRSDREVPPRPSLLSGDAGLDGLSPDRIAELRARLESNAYSSFEVVTALAVRMLESGDLES